MDEVESQKHLERQRWKAKAADMLSPVAHPGQKIEPSRWLNILLFGVNTKTKWRTALISVGGALLFMGGMFILFR